MGSFDDRKRLVAARPITQEHDVSTVELLRNPASVQPVEAVVARLLASPILQYCHTVPPTFYTFHTLRLHSLEANTSVANLASQAVLIKCGFVQEAHFRENWHYNGTFTDSLIFCKLTDVAAQPPIQSS